MSPEPAPVVSVDMTSRLSGATCPASVHSHLPEPPPAVAVCTRCGTFVCAGCQCFGDDDLPYCPACVPAELVLADRGTRLAAAMLDTFLLIPGIVLFGVVSTRDEPLWLVPGLALMLALFGCQLYLSATANQSIGKRLLKIRVARSDGSRVSVARILILRNLIPQLLGAMCNLFGVVDAVLIFGETRRCAHDFIADTIVVKVQSEEPGQRDLR
jgi:uncharacterized RDD family membrane protein YckC